MKRYKKIIKAIENLQKYRADNDIPQDPDSFKAVHAMRQVDGMDQGGDAQQGDGQRK